MSEPTAVDPTRAPIAIIGMACIFPGAADLQAYWNNILNGVDAIGEPTESWGASRYLGDGRIKTQYGGFLKDLYRFDPREFGIMPKSIDGSEPDQFLALRVARDALADAGYARPEADHTDTGIVLGHSTYLHRGQGTLIQQNIVLDQTMDVLKAALPYLDAEALGELRSILQKRLPPTNADTVPGLVPNVMTGRIANRLNLHGPNYLLDAACSSSLLAVGAAIDELRAGRSRLMLAGGVNATLPAEVTTIFTQLGALTTRRKVRPFGVGSDGTLLGEGLGVVALKRLADAVADGDRVYAVLRGVGQSSDGRATSLLAPSHEGEMLAIRRTYETSGIDPASIGLFEAHGTGIPLGDQTEIATLREVFGPRETRTGQIALGSVKSMISHCIPAAGIAGLIKMALSVHHKTLPPTLCEEINPALGIGETPFYVNTVTAPWLSRPGTPRRAAVNAFGFGGTNAHAILEEAPPAAQVPKKLARWPAELCVLSAPTAALLAGKLDGLGAALAAHPAWRLAEVAAALARTDAGELHRVAIVAKDTAALAKSVAQAAERLKSGGSGRWPTRGGVAYGAQRVDGKLAFLFPGEGSQYQRNFAELALHFDVVREWFDFWHGLHDLPAGETRTDVAFPTSEASAELRKELEQALYTMDVGSEAVYIGGLAMFALLRSLGVEADVMLGHSSGESTALSASGANPAASFADQAACITMHHAAYKALLESGKIPSGALLAVGALSAATVEEHLAGSKDVVVAMDNCSNQIVLYGPRDSIDVLQTRLGALGGVCLPLPFDRGYHTPAFSEASTAFLKYYQDIKLGVPKVPLYSCSSVGLFPDKAAGVRKLAAAQWSTRVRFRETVLKMHEDGVHTFVEVGPSANLTAFVNDILGGRDFAALATNVRNKDGIEQLLNTLGHLYVAGRGPAFERLFGSRAIDTIDLAAPVKALRGDVIDNTMPMVRLSAGDRDAILRIATRAAPASLAPAARAAEVAATAAEPAPAAGEPPTSDGRAAVMHDYLDVMKTFLAHQETVVSGFAHGDAGANPEAFDFGDSTHATDGPLPLLDDVLEHDASHVLARCTVSMANDTFARHHVMTGPVSETDPTLFGLSCVPLAVSLELMAEACALLAGRTDLGVIENLRAFDWIALDDDEVTIDVKAEVVDAARGRYTATVLTGRGPALGAEFVFAPERELGPLPALLERRESCWNDPNLYTTGMFHGPVLRSLRHIEAWDDTGVDVALSEASLADFFAPGHTPQLILNPVLLDALGQVVACWLVQFFGTEFNNFPSTFGRIELHEPCPADRPGIVMRARQQPVDGVSTDPGAPRAWQIECVDGEGRVLLRGRDLINVFWKMPPAYHAVRWRPLLGWLGYPSPQQPDLGITLWEVPLLPAEFLLQSGAICLRTLAHVYLNAEERREWRTLQGAPRRRIEWLFGRAALKEAVRHWVHVETGQLLYPTDVRVRVTAHGAPVIDGDWCESLVAAPSVSLSHNDSLCLVAVAPPGEPVGLDLEEIGRLKRPDLVRDSFSPGEVALFSGAGNMSMDEQVLRLHCAKEAASKYLGLGFQGDPQAYQAVSATPGCDKIVVQHASGVVETTLVRNGDSIIALALGSPVAAEVQ
jgi:acyl transferase domain-containing protein/phosphopantetheinyl transferase